MHRTFVFPIKCTNKQVSFKQVEIINIEGKTYVAGYIKESKPYDSFDSIKLLPSLIELVEEVENGKNKEKSIKKWVLQWGLLNGEMIDLNGQEVFSQNLADFWYEAKTFYELWKIYKFILDNDRKALEPLIKDLEETKFHNPNYKIIHNNGNEYKHLYENYQFEATIYLLQRIESRVQTGTLHWSKLTTLDSRIQIESVYNFLNLIDALYMQFYILLSKNENKICKLCNTPFIPGRSDQVYCNDSCKLTAKSRRYRARKKTIL